MDLASLRQRVKAFDDAFFKEHQRKPTIADYKGKPIEQTLKDFARVKKELAATPVAASSVVPDPSPETSSVSENGGGKPRSLAKRIGSESGNRARLLGIFKKDAGSRRFKGININGVSSRSEPDATQELVEATEEKSRGEREAKSAPLKIGALDCGIGLGRVPQKTFTPTTVTTRQTKKLSSKATSEAAMKRIAVETEQLERVGVSDTGMRKRARYVSLEDAEKYFFEEQVSTVSESRRWKHSDSIVRSSLAEVSDHPRSFSVTDTNEPQPQRPLTSSTSSTSAPAPAAAALKMDTPAAHKTPASILGPRPKSGKKVVRTTGSHPTGRDNFVKMQTQFKRGGRGKSGYAGGGGGRKNFRRGGSSGSGGSKWSGTKFGKTKKFTFGTKAAFSSNTEENETELAIEIENLAKENVVDVEASVEGEFSATTSTATGAGGGGIGSASLSPLCDGDLAETLQSVLGFETFKPGQKSVSEKVREGKSCLFISPTGSGKSLCYILPSLHADGLVIVISPLLSLIQDQIPKLPKSLQAMTINSTQKREEQQKVIENISAGKCRIVFVAPERFVSEQFLRVIGRVRVSFVCIDEIHCACEWAHNFRPAYLRLNRIIRERLTDVCVLGLSATCTRDVLAQLQEMFNFSDENIIVEKSIRNNLTLHVTPAGQLQRGELIIKLLKHKCKEGSVIIYCGTQMLCEALAEQLKQSGESADVYHAGRTDFQRKRIQNSFFANKTRIVVGTIAFGMGIDKSDVRTIIHYQPPNSIEAYAQQIGRAGRDGKPANCYLFMNDEDFVRMRSLSHSDGVDPGLIHKLLTSLYSSCPQKIPPLGYLTQLGGDQCVEFDMPTVVIETVLSFLESHSPKLIQILPAVAVSVILESNVYKRKSKTETEPENSMDAPTGPTFADQILKVGKKSGPSVEFSLTALANHMKIDLISVQSLLWKEARSTASRITYNEESATTIRIISNDFDASSLALEIFLKLKKIETKKLERIDELYQILTAKESSLAEGANEVERATSTEIVSDPDSPEAETKKASLQLHERISNYFLRPPQSDDGELADDGERVTPPYHPPVYMNHTAQTLKFLKPDIISFVRQYNETVATPLAVARIMHGLASPAHPTSTWRQLMWWSKYRHIDFDLIESVAAEAFDLVKNRKS